jgi:hypothetical protein
MKASVSTNNSLRLAFMLLYPRNEVCKWPYFASLMLEAKHGIVP